MTGATPPPRHPRTLHEELAADVACIRGDVHGWVGDRSYRVFVVVRSWTGGAPGRGEVSDDRRVELRSGPGCNGNPTPPRVLLEGTWARSMHGVVEQGRAVLEELDPTYTEAQLVNYGRCGEGEETFLEIVQDERDGLAERPVRRFLIDGPPVRDTRRFQWTMRLRSVEPQGVFTPAQEAP